MAGENLDLDHFFQERAVVVSGELPVLAVQDPRDSFTEPFAEPFTE